MSADTASWTTGRQGEPALAVVRRRGSVRRLVVTCALTLVAAAALCVSLSLGEYPIPVPDVVSSLVGAGDPANEFIIVDLRLPRALAAVLTGSAFGLAGTIFQTLLRNPLASPDIIGITAGASAGGVICVALLGLGGILVSTGALVGAIATALAIYLLAWRDGVTGYRLVLIGIAVAAMLLSVISYVITRAEIYRAAEALVWLTGSLNAVSWPSVRLLAICLAVLVPIGLLVGRYLRTLALGDDTASSLGVPVERARLALMLVAVGLVAVATAAAGPVAFVALLAGPIAKRLVGRGDPALVPAMLVGVVVMLVSDLVAQHAISGLHLPVGVVTGIIGGPYLIWLLVTTNRTGRAG